MTSDNEAPQYKLKVPEYRIARVPVTNAQYRQFVRASKHRKPSHWKYGKIPRGKEDHPVVNVNWHDAHAFCKWANVQLPTEAQWEKAARGTDGRIYPWGDDPPTDERCNFERNVGDTSMVGNYPDGASPFGLLDMAGNVWEWTSSLFKSYPYDADDGREDPEATGHRTLRGGSWFNFDGDVRCAFRSLNNPVNRNFYNGFRVVSPGF